MKKRAEADPLPETSQELIRRLQGGTDLLTSAALERLDQDLPWYRDLPAEDRSWIGLVVQSGIKNFIAWYESGGKTAYNAAEIFRAAPPELTRSISLQHTLHLVRIIVEVVESHSHTVAPPELEPSLREAVLKYSRDVAFSAADVYARAAESRGAWDARLEALIVDSLLRGDADDSLRSRVAALGWAGKGSTFVMVGHIDGDISDMRAADLRRAARRAASDALVGIHGDRLIVVLGGEGDLRSQAETLLPRFGKGPVIIGPQVDNLADAPRSARAALSGLKAVTAWPNAPRPVMADELLPERMLIGDQDARHTLEANLYQPLVQAGSSLLETLSAYIDEGRSLEATARVLYVHPNTVRYRLRRIASVTGWDPSAPREGFVLHMAIAAGRLAETNGSR